MGELNTATALVPTYRSPSLSLSRTTQLDETRVGVVATFADTHSHHCFEAGTNRVDRLIEPGQTRVWDEELVQMCKCNAVGGLGKSHTQPMPPICHCQFAIAIAMPCHASHGKGDLEPTHLCIIK